MNDPRITDDMREPKIVEVKEEYHSSIIKDVMERYGPNCRIDYEKEYSYSENPSIALYVYYKRTENKEEVAKRIKATLEQMDRNERFKKEKEAKELEEFERLKKKFENKT